mgnify:CR=1 FL=1
MDALKLIGVSERQGNYEGTNYHNIYFHCTFYDERFLGEMVETVKIKAVDIINILGFECNSFEDFDELLGRKFYCYYNKNGVVNKIDFIDDAIIV